MSSGISIESVTLFTQKILPDQKVLLCRSFEEIFSIARKARPRNAQEVLQRLDSKNKELPNQKIVAEIETGKEIWLSAQDFTIGNNLELSIINFLEQSVGAKISTVFSVDPSRVTKRESVYLTEDYAVKVFPQVEKYFDKITAEISGLDIIKKLSLQEGKTTNFIAVGKCVIDSKDNLLLLMQRAPGKTIKSYLDDIFTLKNSQLALNECKCILTQLGRLLGEIHSNTAVTVKGDIPGILEITFEKLKFQIAKYIEGYKVVGGNDSESIVKFFNDIIAQYDTKTFHLTLSHNDAHLENFLYDRLCGITLIDTSRIHYSVNEHDEPLFASHVHDVARVEDDIAKWILYHENNEVLIVELQEAFRKGYREKAHKLINASQLFADKAWTFLTRLKSVIPNRDQEGPNGRIYQYYSKFFKKTHSIVF